MSDASAGVYAENEHLRRERDAALQDVAEFREAWEDWKKQAMADYETIRMYRNTHERLIAERDDALALAERRAGALEVAKDAIWLIGELLAGAQRAGVVCDLECHKQAYDLTARYRALAAAPPPATTNEDALQRLITAATRLCAVSWDNDGRLWEMRCELRDVLESLAAAPPPASEDAGGE